MTAANVVVTRDVPDYSIAAGIPVRVIRSRRADHSAAAATRAALTDMAAKIDLDPIDHEKGHRDTKDHR